LKCLLVSIFQGYVKILAMHEFSIVQGFIQQIEEYLCREKYKKVLKICLEVGEMSGVIHDALEFAYDICSKGTKVEGAKLCISMVPVKVRCRRCEKEFLVEDYCFSCPGCKGTDFQTVSGYQLNIKEMEVED